MFLGHLYLQLDSICFDEVRGGPCHFITTCFNSSALQTFLWEHSLNYQKVGNDNGQIRERFKNMSRHILSRYPDLRVNLLLVYCWVGLRVKDPDLVPSLDFEECVVWRPYSYRYAGFSCHSVLYWFSDIASQSFELLPDDNKSLTYLSAVNLGWLPVWSSKGVEYTHYCANRIRRQFGLDQGVPSSPSATLPQVPNIAPFLKDQVFGYWNQSVSRMVILCGGRLDICTVAMQEYWLRVAVAMADYIGQGRGTRVPLLTHHAHLVKTATLFPPTQTAISYADRQNLGFAKWDGRRGGWILYNTKFPSGWKESVKVVEEQLKLDSKRGKGGKKADSSKGDSSPTTVKQKSKSAAKTPSRRPKVAMNKSIIPPSELGDRSLITPGTSKKSVAGSSKTRKKLDVGSPEGSSVDPSIPSKEAVSSVVRKKSTPPPAKAASATAPKKAKGKFIEKSAIPASSPDGASLVGSAMPAEKGSAVPIPSGTMYDRTRSKRKAAIEQAQSKVNAYFPHILCHCLLHTYDHCLVSCTHLFLFLLSLD